MSSYQAATEARTQLQQIGAYELSSELCFAKINSRAVITTKISLGVAGTTRTVYRWRGLGKQFKCALAIILYLKKRIKTFTELQRGLSIRHTHTKRPTKRGEIKPLGLFITIFGPTQ